MVYDETRNIIGRRCPECRRIVWTRKHIDGKRYFSIHREEATALPKRLPAEPLPPCPASQQQVPNN